jgi:AraC-like DNA-binding protein
MRAMDWSSGRVMAGLSLAVLDAARGAGVSLDDVLDAHGVEAETLTRSDAYVPVALHEALWAEGARRSGDPHFGIRAAQEITPGQTGVVEYILRNCATMEDVALTWVRFAAVVSDRIEGALVEDGPRLRLEWRLARPPSPGVEQWTVFAQARSLRLMRDALGEPRLAPSEVWFRHAAPPSTDGLSAYFLAPIRFDRPVAALVWDHAVRDRPLRWVDPAARAALEARAEQLRDALTSAAPDIAAQVRATLGELLAEPRRDLRLTTVAARLRVPPRTLQAHLGAAGASFRALAEAVRAEAAQRLLEGEGVTVAEAARRLGFGDASALRKARRRWQLTQGPGRKR